MKLTPDTRMGKEQFLIEHNKLSPVNLQATFALLTSFQKEKRPFLKDADWSNKLRIPFISWLIALPPIPPTKQEHTGRLAEQEYKIYPKSE